MVMMEDLKGWGKEFASMQESLDTSTAMGRFVVDIIQRIAQLESEVIGERVYVGMEQKAKTVGGVLGFKVPYGYDYSGGLLEVLDGEAKVVQRIYSDYVAGLGTKKIAHVLNAEGVATKNCARWSGAMVRYILRNPLYAGFNHWDGHLKRGAHAPIVTPEEFNRVQFLLAARTKVPYRRKEVFALPAVEAAPTTDAPPRPEASAA
jgi:DNA invertase Pin-like site-specific DNA recombinase